jgi:hypothetical protein
MSTKVETILEIYKDVTYNTEDKTQSHTPAVGPFTITMVCGEAAFDTNVAVILKFDGDPIWITKGSSLRTEPIELVGDNTKKVELVLDANDLPSGSVYIGGMAKIVQET